MATVKELKAELTKRGVDFDPKSKKAALEELLAKPASQEEAPVATEPEVGAEGPTELPQDPAPVQPEVKKGEPVLVSNLLRNGVVVKAGNPVPTDLTDAEQERLERLGIIGIAE